MQKKNPEAFQTETKICAGEFAYFRLFHAESELAEKSSRPEVWSYEARFREKFLVLNLCWKKQPLKVEKKTTQYFKFTTSRSSPVALLLEFFGSAIPEFSNILFFIYLRTL